MEEIGDIVAQAPVVEDAVGLAEMAASEYKAFPFRVGKHAPADGGKGDALDGDVFELAGPLGQVLV